MRHDRPVPDDGVPTATSLAEQRVLSYRRPQQWGLDGLVRLVAVLGIGIGSLRAALGAMEFGYPGIFDVQSWWHTVIVSPFYAIAGALGLLLGVNLVIASFGCLNQKPWGRLLVLLGEPAAVVLILVSFAMWIFEMFQDSPGVPEHLAWDLGHMLRDLLANVTYPILAVAILRSRAARTYFVETAGEDPITPSQP